MNALCLGLSMNHADDLDYTPRTAYGFDMATHMDDLDSTRFESSPETDAPLFDQSII